MPNLLPSDAGLQGRPVLVNEHRDRGDDQRLLRPGHVVGGTQAREPLLERPEARMVRLHMIDDAIAGPVEHAEPERILAFGHDDQVLALRGHVPRFDHRGHQSQVTPGGPILG